MIRTVIRAGFKGASTLAIAFACTPSWAQTADAGALPSENAQGAGEIADIVVTAQKGARAESVQRVPLAITAMDENALRSAQLTTATDIGRLVPNAQLGQASFPGFPSFFIRGIGLNGTVRTIDPAVTVTVDGMVHDFQLGLVLDTLDIQAVEVLRGPQGILFGRNATGGAMSFTTRRPKNEFEAEMRATVGTSGRFDVAGLIAGPIISDKLLAKLSVVHRESDGQFRDSNKGTFAPSPFNPAGADSSRQGRQVSADVWAIRPTIVVKPVDALTVTLLGEYIDDRGGGAATKLKASVPNLVTYFGYTDNLGRDEINHDFEGRHHLRSYRAIGDVQIDTGIGIITSVTGYRDVSYTGTLDVDGTPFTFFHLIPGTRDDSTQFSQELRFASDFSDRFSFVAGGYYSELSISGAEARETSSFFGGGATNNRRFLQGSWDQDSTTQALFYNLEYRPMPELRLSHGGRYTKDRKTIDIIPLGVCTGPGLVNCPGVSSRLDRDWDNFSPKFAAEYQLASRTMAYGSYTYGYRSGSFNSRANSVAAVGPADPETIRQVELGIKTTFWDGRARVNLAAFKSKYDDIQRTVGISGVQTLANAASATLQGFELETNLRPVDGLDLTGNIGYIDAKYDAFFGLDVNGGGYDPAVDPLLARKLKFDLVPKWTAFGQASYTFDIPGVGPEMNMRASYSYTGRQALIVTNDVSLGAINMVDASVSMNGENWRITAFGRNLLNDTTAGQGARFNYGPGPGGAADIIYPGALREFGVELSYRF